MINSMKNEALENNKIIPKLPTATACRTRHFEIAERLVKIVEHALEDELEPYRYVETLKDGASTVLDCSALGALNEVRLGRIVKLLSDLFDIQRTAIGIPCVKEKNDAKNAEKKLTQELRLANRKFELDLMKLEREYSWQEINGADDGFLKALGSVDFDSAEVNDDSYDE